MGDFVGEMLGDAVGLLVGWQAVFESSSWSYSSAPHGVHVVAPAFVNVFVSCPAPHPKQFSTYPFS